MQFVFPLFLATVIRVDVNQIVGQTDPKFLSVAIDSHVIAERWKNLNFSMPRVENMAKVHDNDVIVAGYKDFFKSNGP
jgi:hypothetical protein